MAVSVRDLSKSFGNFSALQHVSFEVRKGDCLGIVGLNGAGKSTLLQILAGTLQPTGGSVRTTGRVVALLELGAGFNEEFTGRENVRLNAAILGLPPGLIERRMPDIEAFAEIGDFVDRPVKTYSSGMRVRLAFSLLTQVEPDIMIIDEALAVGDAYFAHKCARVIRKFREQGRTLLFVSHDPTAVRTLCDRAILLDHGTILRSGTPIEILDYYNAMIAVRARDAEIRQAELASGRRLTRSGNHKATLERFELLDTQDRPVRAVQSGQEVRICCVVRFHAALADPTVGFLIRDRLGNDIFGTNTFHLRLQAGTFAPGECGEFSFTTQLKLGAGNYSLTLAVHSGPGHEEDNYDWFDQLLAFSVMPTAQFFFVGCAALPASVELSRAVHRLRRRCDWDEPIPFDDRGLMLRYQLEGWSLPEAGLCWTNGTRAVLAFELPPESGNAVLEMDVEPYLAPSQAAQAIEIRCAGRALATWSVETRGLQTVAVPAELTNTELVLELHCPQAVAPARLGGSTDQRQLALAVRQVRWFQRP